MPFRTFALAALLASLAPALPGLAAAASAEPVAIEMQGLHRACQRALPSARRFIGLPGRVAQRRFRAPRGVVVRACAICTRDYRPNRLTFGLDMTGIVRSATCG